MTDTHSSKRERDIRLGKIQPTASILKFKIPIKEEVPAPIAVPIAKKSPSPETYAERAARRAALEALKAEINSLHKRINQALMDEESTRAGRSQISGIVRKVGEFYKVPVRELLSPRRKAAIVKPRQVAMYLTKEMTTHSLPTIGRAIGGRDHTTVMHACTRVEEMLKDDPAFAEEVKTLTLLLQDEASQ